MAIKVTMKQTASPVPEGLYDATVTSVDTTDSQYGPGLKITFTLEANDGTTDKPYKTALHYFTSQKLSDHPKSKLGNLCKTLGITVLGELDAEDLIGKPAKLVVKNVSKKGQDGQPRTFSQITDILRA